MICSWLERGALCSRLARRLMSVETAPHCTYEERVIAKGLEAAYEGAADAPEIAEMLEVLAAKAAPWLAQALKEDVVGVDADVMLAGPELGRVAVVAGRWARRVAEWAAPFSVLVPHVVFSDAYTAEEQEEVWRQWGARAVVTMFRRPPWRLTTYVVACESPGQRKFAAAVVKALGFSPLEAGEEIAPGLYLVE
jgi:hypothetical protein